jgi:hypothetical protein
MSKNQFIVVGRECYVSVDNVQKYTLREVEKGDEGKDLETGESWVEGCEEGESVVYWYSIQ